MKKQALILLVVGVVILTTTANSQTRRRTPAKPPARTSKTTIEKSAADVKRGREMVALQIKTLTQFLYIFGGIVKGVESVDQAIRTKQASPGVAQQNEQSKAKIRTSLRSVREGLDKVEAEFRFNDSLKSFYYSHLAGAARLAETAESQAAANRFDEAGRSLLRIVNQLADALAAMR